MSLDQVNILPVDPTPIRLGLSDKTTKCVFATSKIALSPFILVDEGFLIECEIPIDVLPSYKGRSTHVNYYISVFLQSEENLSAYHFPISVHGRGSKELPFPIK